MTFQDNSIEVNHPKTASIEVNEHKVTMAAEKTTGREIKGAAIQAGVNIQLNFVLLVQLPNGSSRVVGDNEMITPIENLAFNAIAADDNS